VGAKLINSHLIARITGRSHRKCWSSRQARDTVLSRIRCDNIVEQATPTSRSYRRGFIAERLADRQGQDENPIIVSIEPRPHEIVAQILSALNMSEERSRQSKLL
jgi:hypothetical protein